MEQWDENFSRGKDNEKLLIQQKYHFPEDYKNAEVKEKEFRRFKQIYQYKTKQFESNIDNIKNSLNKEEEVLLIELDKIKQLWNEKKPFAADMKPEEALGVLDMLEKTIQTNREKLENLNKAKALLELPEIDLDIMYLIVDDSAVLRKMWEKVQEIWQPC